MASNYVECQSCMGYGGFDSDGNPSIGRRDRECLDCRGTGAVAKRLCCDLNQSLRVRLHHESQFGAVDWCRLGIKLGEESGELQGKIIRFSEKRDGKDWRPEMLSELKDVLTVLHVIASRLEKDLNDLSSEAAEYFVTRDFPNIEKQNSAENLQ